MAKKEKKKKVKVKKGTRYNIEGEKTKRKNKFCPKCGAGVFLAEHKDRLSCGRCSYTEMKIGGK